MANGLKRYKQRTQNNPQESYLNRAKKEFEDYFRQAPNKYTFKKFTDGKIDQCTWVDVDKGNYYQSFDDKFVLTKASSVMDKGEVLTFKETHFNKEQWMIIDEENLGVDSHRKYRIRPTNEILKFRVNGKLYEIPFITENQTLYATGLNDTMQVKYPNAIFSCQIGFCHEGVENINRDFRFMVKINKTNSVYKVNYLQKNKNILTFQCTETTFMAEDDMEEGIAYNDFKIDNDIVEETKEYTILGNENINKASEYIISNVADEEFKFEIDDDSLVELERKDNKMCILIPKYGQGWINLKATFNDIILEKDILVKGR